MAPHPRHAAGTSTPGTAEMATAMADALQGPLRELASSQQTILHAIGTAQQSAAETQQATAQQLSTLTSTLASMMWAIQSPEVQQSAAAAIQARQQQAAQQAAPAVMGALPGEDGWPDISFMDPSFMDQQ